MIKIVSVFLLVAIVSSFPVKRDASNDEEAQELEEEWLAIEEVLEEYGVDAEVVAQKIEEYLQSPAVVIQIKEIIKNNLPASISNAEFEAAAQEIVSSPGSDTDKWELIREKIRELTGADAEAIIDKVDEFFDDEQFIDKLFDIVMELLPPGTNEQDVEAALEAIFEY